MHLANHSTYHRGQVALKMLQLKAAPVATDFALFLLEGRREAADAGDSAGEKSLSNEKTKEPT